MKDILDEIIREKRAELDVLKRSVSMESVFKEALEITRPVISLKHALEVSEYGIIAEFKRKSPSKGWINSNVEPETVTRMYERGGASADRKSVV